MARVGSPVSRAVIYVVLVLVAIYTVVPTAIVVVTSFRSEPDLAQGPFTWPREFRIIENFVEAFQRARFGRYFGNTLVITAPTVLMVIVFGTLAGYGFAKIPFPGRAPLFYLVMLTMMVPFQAVMIPQYFLMSGLGLLNSRAAVVLAIGSGGAAFGTFMMRAFFMTLSDELVESAKLDGCGEFATFYHIMLPLTFPAWVTLIIFQTMWSWNNLLAPLIYIYDERLKPITQGLMFFQDRYTTDYTLLSAAILMSLVPLIVLYFTLQRNFTTGITMGALKG